MLPFLLLGGEVLATTYSSNILDKRGLPPPVAINDQSYTNCANAAWPPSDVGVEVTPQVPDNDLKSMLDEISPANIEATITKLVSFGTRHTLSTSNSTTRGINAARDWIALKCGNMRPKVKAG